LFSLEDINARQISDDKCIPCTSKPCEWNKPSKRNWEPVSVENINFKKMKYGHESKMKDKQLNYEVQKNEDKDFFNIIMWQT